MAADSLLITAGILQSCIPLLSLSAYVPQWRTLLRSRSSANVSCTAWLIWTLSSAIALFYAVANCLALHTGLPLVFSTSVMFVFCLFTLVLVYRFRTPPP